MYYFLLVLHVELIFLEKNAEVLFLQNIQIQMLGMLFGKS